jgi:lipoprotein-releasing system permease protein
MYKFLLSIRYFRSRFLAIASLLAIAFGVAMLVIVLGIMGGYLFQLQENLRGQSGHLLISGPQKFGVTGLADLESILLEVDEIEAVTPFVEQLGVYHSGLSFRPCLLVGISPEGQSRVGKLARFTLRPDELEQVLLDDGSVEDPDPNVRQTTATRATRAARLVRRVDRLLASSERRDLTSEEMSGFFDRVSRQRLLEGTDPRRLEALDGQIPQAALVGLQLIIDREMAIGDIITFVTMSPASKSSETLYRDFVVAGAVKTGDFDQDSGVIYADIDVVKNWLPLWSEEEGDYRYQGVRIAIRNPERLEEAKTAVRKAIESRFPYYDVSTWKEEKQNLIRAVEIEKFLVYFIVLILVVFTGSMILLMLILTVIEKTRDVGVLLSLGATPAGVTSLFLWNGLMLCVAGTTLGLGLGFVFCRYINEIHDAIQATTGISLFNPRVYHMDRIPIAFVPIDVFLSTVPPVCIGFLASIIPAVWAPRRDPIRSIQYE